MLCINKLLQLNCRKLFTERMTTLIWGGDKGVDCPIHICLFVLLNFEHSTTRKKVSKVLHKNIFGTWCVCGGGGVLLTAYRCIHKLLINRKHSKCLHCLIESMLEDERKQKVFLPFLVLQKEVVKIYKWCRVRKFPFSRVLR